MRILVTILLIVAAIADCPVNPYPRQTVTGFLQAALNNDPRLHGLPQEYVYNLDDELNQGAISVATGLVGLQLNPRSNVDFSIDYVPSSVAKSLKFLIQVNDLQFGWRVLQFNFFASQSNLFYVGTQSTASFSVYNQGKYSNYSPLQKFTAAPNINAKVFISGLKMKAKALDNEYTTMLGRFQSFKKFSTNTRLIKYFSQAIDQKKSLSFKITSSKVLGRVLSINFDTNCQISLLRYSYIIVNPATVNEKYNFITGDFYLINGEQFRLTPLQNMNMNFVGLNQVKFFRDQLYTTALSFSNFMGQAYYESDSNTPYFGTGYSYFAVQMKPEFTCDDCLSGKIIFENRFCVQACPRGYSQSKGLNNVYCDRCQISKIKVVDPNTQSCVCAKRHYLDIAEDTCKPCRYDCMTCDRPDRCLTCDNNLQQTKRKLTQSGKCQCPIIGFYDDKAAQNIVCQKCSPKCNTCNGPRDFDCLTCVSGKQTDFRGFCVCKNGFVQDNSGNCVCPPPRLFVNSVCLDNTSCGPNQVQQYVDFTRKCVCRSGYEQVLNTCIKCSTNSVFSSEQLKCICINNTVMINNECLPCPFNTQFEQVSKTCVCKAGTFKSDSGICVNCPPRMTYLNGRCECIFNYYEAMPGFCQRCLRESDGVKCRKSQG